MTTHTPIDGPEVPKGDGSTDPDHVTRDLEHEMERVLAALVDQEQRVHRCGRRVAYVRVTTALRTLVTP